MLRRRNPEEPRVLSFAQEGLWYLDQLTANSSAYNVAYRLRLTGPLDAALLEKSIRSVVQRQEVLRTVFMMAGGRPTPFALAKPRFALKQRDLRSLPAAEREAEASRFIHEEACSPFNLARDSLFRASLYRLDDEEYALFHVAPHIVFEGGSVTILYRELSAFYRGEALPPLEVEFADFALWQRENLSGNRLQELCDFWRDQLDGLQPLDLLCDHPRPAIHRMRGTRHYFAMPPALLADAHRFFREARTTTYRGLLAAFNVFLYCYSGVTDLCVGSPFRPLNPRCPALENVIGYFVNTVAIRTRFTPANTFRELLKIVDMVLWEAVTHSDLTFGKVVEAVQPPRDPSRLTLAQVNFRSPRQANPALQLDGIQSGRAEYVDTGSSKFDLALEIESSTGEASYFEYCTDLFDESTVLRMTKDYQELLSALISSPDAPLSRLVETGGWGAERRRQ